MTVVGAIMLAAGIVVLLLMFTGMFLLTPSGSVAVHAEGSDGQGSNLSPTTAPALPAKIPAKAV